MFAPDHLLSVAKFFLYLAGELIVLFVGITFIVGLMLEFIPQEKVKRLLTRGWKGVGNVIGAGFGAITPFCSCSTIPVLLGLLESGVPFGVSMSFLIASPLLNPIIIGLFITLLGLKVTIIYILITFPAAVIIGMLLEKFGYAKYLKSVSVIGGEGEDSRPPLPANATFMQKALPRIQGAGGAAVALFRQVFVYLLVGAGIGAVIYGFVPEGLIVKSAGPNNPAAIPVAAVIGVLMYIRAATMLPISAVLLQKGMGIGAVMALIIGGAGASIPEVTLLAAIFKRRLVVAFVATVFGVAILAGYLFTLLAVVGI
jgi:uncharacterized membrane protein YraQ (UPF0718 family)